MVLGLLLIVWGAAFQTAASPAPPLPRLAAFLGHTLVYPSELIIRSGFHKLRDGDLDGAMQLMQESLRRDPASAYRWCDLGNVLARSGLSEGATYSFRRAAELGPQTPGVLLRAASGLTEVGRSDQALPYGARTLALTDQYDLELFSLYHTLKLPIADVIARGIPDRRAAAGFFRYALNNNVDAAELATAWKCMTAHSLTDDQTGSVYASHLIDLGKSEAAVAVWKAQLGNRAGDYPLPNRVVNGGFEFPFTDGILDWNIIDNPHVHVTRDLQQEAHSGRASLRLDFDGTANLLYADVRQSVVLSPGRYRLVGWVRPSSLTTDQGLGFWIQGGEGASALDVRTPKVRGTSPWTPLEATFAVPAGMPVVIVSVLRETSVKFDHDIGGTVWVDDVTLEPIGR